MRLIWTKYDKKFESGVATWGLWMFLIGSWAFSLVAAAALRHPVAWIIAAICLMPSLICVITLLREYQLWRQREQAATLQKTTEVETRSRSPFERSPGVWVIVGGLLLLNVWFDYYHPVWLIIDGVIVFIVIVELMSAR